MRAPPSTRVLRSRARATSANSQTRRQSTRPLTRSLSRGREKTTDASSWIPYTWPDAVGTQPDKSMNRPEATGAMTPRKTPHTPRRPSTGSPFFTPLSAPRPAAAERSGLSTPAQRGQARRRLEMGEPSQPRKEVSTAAAPQQGELSDSEAARLAPPGMTTRVLTRLQHKATGAPLEAPKDHPG